MARWQDKGSDFVPCPQGGQAVTCADWASLGPKETQWGVKDKCALWFVSSNKMDDGQPFILYTQMTESLHEKAKLHQFLAQWFGRQLTVQETKNPGLDPDSLLGRPAYVTVIHNEGSNGKIYANIQSIIPLPEGMAAPSIPPDYKRWKDREHEKIQAAVNARGGTLPSKDDDIPF